MRKFLTFPPYARLGLGIALIIILIDQLTKAGVLYNLHMLALPRFIEITPFFNFVLVWNHGVSFGMLQNDAAIMPYILIGIAVILTVFVGIWLWRAESRAHALGCGLIIGGAMGNVIDRLHHGAVADFLDFHAFGYHYPAFNIADSGICIGAGIILFLSLRQAKKTV